MDDSLAVQVTYPETYLKGNKPNEFFCDAAPSLFDGFQVPIEVTFLTVFHDDVKTAVLHEGIVVSHHMRMVLKHFKQLDLSESLAFVPNLQSRGGEVDFLHDIDFSVLKGAHLIYSSVRSFAQLLNNLKIAFGASDPFCVFISPGIYELIVVCYELIEILLSENVFRLVIKVIEILGRR